MPLLTKQRGTATLIFWWIVGLIPVVGFFWSLISQGSYEVEQSSWRLWVEQFGAFSPIAFVALQAAQVVITPMNHYVIGVLGGFLFGAAWGGALNYVGRVIGHAIAFALARRFARAFAQKWVSAENLAHYDRIVGDRPAILFLIYFLPFFPDDEVSYLVGFSKMNWKSFAGAMLFGHVGGSWSLSYVGAGVGSYDTFFWVLTFATLAGFPLIAYLLRRKKVKERDLL